MPETRQSARILIVDDEAAQMKALCDTLRDHGYDTVGFKNGEAALEALQKSTFDLVLVDLMMPEMDGIALLRSAFELDPNLVGIIMTGKGTIDTAVGAMKAGALDYILKPFKLSAILPVLDRALAVRRLRLQNAALQKRVEQRTAELEAANQELEAFASTVAHDLHAPARHIYGFVRILLEDRAGEMSEAVQRELRRIIETAERMGELIASLLAFSRIVRTEIRPTSVDLNEIVAQTWRQLEAETAHRQIQFTVANLPAARADATLIGLVFYNLLSNAIKYTRDRSPAVIEVGSQPGEGKEKVFFVRDNGVGFDMKYAGKLFGLFERLHAGDGFEGTGVGLSTVQRIIQRHGGRIWAEAAADRGATFLFTLPE